MARRFAGLLLVAAVVLALAGRSSSAKPPPPATLKYPSINAFLNRTSGFDVLKQAIKMANLTDYFGNPFRRLTCFFPNDTAWQDLVAGTPVNLTQLLADTPSLTNDLLYHCHHNDLTLAKLPRGNLLMLNNQNVTIIRDDKKNVFVKDAIHRRARVYKSNIKAGFSYIHLIKGVLVPRFNTTR